MTHCVNAILTYRQHHEYARIPTHTTNVCKLRAGALCYHCVSINTDDLIYALNIHVHLGL